MTEAMIIKVGDKGRHVEIPEGWKLLDRDAVSGARDMALNIYTLKWTRLDSDEVGLPAYAVGDYVIRLTENQ